MNSAVAIQLVAVIAFTLTAMITDLKWRRIPNPLTVGAFVLGLVFHLVTGGWDGLLFALGGFAVGFGFLLVLWLIGGGGGGDVKLMGAMGAWLGAKSTLIVFVLSAFISFLCLLVMMVVNACSTKPATAGASGQGSKVAGGANSVFRQKIPYAVPAGISAWAILLAKMFTG